MKEAFPFGLIGPSNLDATRCEVCWPHISTYLDGSVIDGCIEVCADMRPTHFAPSRIEIRWSDETEWKRFFHLTDEPYPEDLIESFKKEWELTKRRWGLNYDCEFRFSYDHDEDCREA